MSILLAAFFLLQGIIIGAILLTFYRRNTLELFTQREFYEGMKPEQLEELRDDLLDKYSRYERAVHLINEVLDGYGVEYDSDLH